ncbi:MAG: Nif3-like dinuclear metal center hexameric protein [Christensenellaceae bacterium]
MSVSLKQMETIIEGIAPKEYACEWDNTGFHVKLNNEISRVMLCLDVTPEVIKEAAQKKCDLLIAHHPLIFKPIKNIDIVTYEGECLSLLLQHHISLYCAHTSMDSVVGGINTYLADIFHLTDRTFLEPTGIQEYYEVTVSVPQENAGQIRDAFERAGAGEIGNYSGCSFSYDGVGRFCPDEDSHAYIGTIGKMEEVDEQRVCAVCPKEKINQLLTEVRAAHPYEQPAIQLSLVQEPKIIKAGLGIIGEVTETPAKVLLDIFKKAVDTDSVRFMGDLNTKIKKIAVCGGGGGDLIACAKALGAQLYLTGEVKHNFYAAEKDICIAEAGHFDTEKCFCEIYAKSLQKALNELNYKVSVDITENLRRYYVNY